MKRKIYFVPNLLKRWVFLSFIATTCFNSMAQIQFEKEYSNFIYRQALDANEAVYVETDNSMGQIKLYDNAHTLFKTIHYTPPASHQVNYISTLSKNIFNNDNQIEFAAHLLNTIQMEHVTEVVDESGVSLMQLNGIENFYISEPSWGNKKIIGYGESAGVVFDPGTPQNGKHYQGNISEFRRVNFDLNGEKYYYTDRVNNTVEFYNSDHTHWKTIQLPSIVGSIVLYVDMVSENFLNSTNDIELFVTYNNSMNDQTVYAIDENGTLLQSFPNASIASFAGSSNDPKLLIQSENSSAVYSLPSMQLAHNFSNGIAHQYDLKHYGKKYVLVDYTAQKVEIYDLNFQLWKTVDVPLPSNVKQAEIRHISHDIINPDSQLEFMIYYRSKSPGQINHGTIVIDEMGTILEHLVGIQFAEINSIVGHPSKLFALDLNQQKTTVYSLGGFNTSTTDRDKQNESVQFYPNPVKQQLQWYANISEPTQFKLLNLNGEIVKTFQVQGNTSIDVSQLTAGVYFITGSIKGDVFNQKIIVQ